MLIGHVGDGANHYERYAEVMAHVRNRGRFHFNGNRLREVVADFRQTHGTIDEGVAADDQAAYGVEVQLGDAAFCCSHQLIVGFKTCRTTRQLAVLVTECCDIGIVITRFIGDHDIAHFQGRSQTARRTGIDDHVRFAALKQQGCAQCCRYFTDA
ncbi:hypothetical protein D3C72_1933450 [compost metagenome]